MKNRLLFLGIILCIAIVANAQIDESLNKFMTTYSKSWDATCFGKAIPDYSFSEKYNKKQLQGKNTLFFLGSLTDDNLKTMALVDSMRNIGQFDATLIAINTANNSVSTYWTQKRMHFPCYEGKVVNKFAKTFKVGEGVTAVLVNPEGIICGRWNNVDIKQLRWVKTAIWALTAPIDQMDVSSVGNYFKRHDTYRAFYISEMLDEDKIFDQLWSIKLVCMAGVAFDHILPFEKKIYAWNKANCIKDKVAYEKNLYYILYAIAGPSMPRDLCEYNAPICEELIKLNPDKYNNDYVFIDQYRCFLGGIEGNKDKCIALLNKCIAITEAKMKNDPGMKVTVDYFKRQLLNYK